MPMLHGNERVNLGMTYLMLMSWGEPRTLRKSIVTYCSDPLCNIKSDEFWKMVFCSFSSVLCSRKTFYGKIRNVL